MAVTGGCEDRIDSDREREVRPRRILVMDEYEGVTDVVGRLLRSGGYSTLVAENEPKALALLSEEVPDLAIVDVPCPNWYGNRRPSSLLSSLRTLGIPIICTALCDAARRDVVPMEGVVDVVMKPFDLDDLLGRIETVLSKGRAGMVRGVERT